MYVDRLLQPSVLKCLCARVHPASMPENRDIGGDLEDWWVGDRLAGGAWRQSRSAWTCITCLELPLSYWTDALRAAPSAIVAASVLRAQPVHIAASQ